jgi:hypothetical protein
LEDAEKAVGLAPTDANILDTRGQIYSLALGRFNEAFADLDRAISKGIVGSGTYLGRGRCYEQNGNRDAPTIAKRCRRKSGKTTTTLFRPRRASGI